MEMGTNLTLDDAFCINIAPCAVSNSILVKMHKARFLHGHSHVALMFHSFAIYILW